MSLLNPGDNLSWCNCWDIIHTLRIVGPGIITFKLKGLSPFISYLKLQVNISEHVSEILKKNTDGQGESYTSLLHLVFVGNNNNNALNTKILLTTNLQQQQQQKTNQVHPL